MSSTFVDAAGAGAFRGLWDSARARLRASGPLRRSLVAWLSAGLLLSEAFAVGVAQMSSQQAVIIAGIATLAWWLAVTTTFFLGIPLLVSPDGRAVNCFGVPNGLTALRAYSCPGLVCCAFLSTPHRLGFILWGTIGAVAALLDLVDGYIARRVGPLTRLGETLDPVMDCAFFGMAAAGNVALGIIPAWLGGLIAARYLGPLAVGLFLQFIGRRPELTSTPWGKRTTILTGAILAIQLVVRSVDGPVDLTALVVAAPTLGTMTLLHYAALIRREQEAPTAGGR